MQTYAYGTCSVHWSTYPSLSRQTNTIITTRSAGVLNISKVTFTVQWRLVRWRSIRVFQRLTSACYLKKRQDKPPKLCLLPQRSKSMSPAWVFWSESKWNCRSVGVCRFFLFVKSFFQSDRYVSYQIQKNEIVIVYQFISQWSATLSLGSILFWSLFLSTVNM